MTRLMTEPRSPSTSAEEPRRSPFLLLAASVLAAGLLIVAHGCHGADEDHELFVRQAVPSAE